MSRSEPSADDTTSPPLPPERQCTYLVFETSLLLLFTMCVYCGNAITKVKKKIMGSFLHITQWCEKCKRKRMWDSQPYIGNIPAGNILASASILYSGSLPSKALHIFKILNCSMITSRSFFYHQSKYLQPSVHSVWVEHQKKLLAFFKEENRQLIVAGDGRSDSPGHSAKYGSYSIVELTCNKVVDFKLVQVCDNCMYCTLQSMQYNI